MKRITFFTFIHVLFFYPIALLAQTNFEISEKSDASESVFSILEIEVQKPSDELIKSAQNTAVNIQDSLALVDLYNSTGGTNWTENYGWLDQSVYYWKGIVVENGRVVVIELDDNNLTGTIPSSIGNLSALTALDLSENNLTGNIPLEIGNLVNLEGDYKRDGLLTYIYDRGLDLSENNLTGTIPATLGSLTKTREIALNNNNLSGEIPETLGLLQKAYFLKLQGNNLTGTIPPEIGRMSNLVTLDLGGNNLFGEIPQELGDLDSMTSFGAAQNNLSGTISPDLFINGKLIFLSLAQNELEGPLPESMSIPYFGYLSLSSNQLTDLPNISLYYDMPFNMGTTVVLDTNNFNFNDLEQFTELEITRFFYAPQDTITLEKNTIGNVTELSMDAGGTKTTYQWFYDGTELSGETNQRITVLPQNEIEKYHCEAKQSLLPDLILYGKISGPEKDCWEVGQLKFCLNSGSWKEGEEPNQITSTSIISINNFLYFNGTMTIDTLALEVSANGEFYVDNISLPGGSFGKYTLLEGNQHLTLIGSEGKIMDFLNSGLSKTASLFGARLSIDDLQFFSRQDTIGMKIGCSAHIPWISESCGTPGIYTPGTDLKLKNFEITNKGIMSAGFEVENIGLFKKGHCLKKISYEYDLKKDIITGGADIALPFFKVELDGGYKIEKGEIDSVAWGIEYLPGEKDKLKAIPIGFATMGVKGFRGHVSGLNQPGEFNPLILDIELGGLFSDLTADWLYKLEGDGNIIWPKVFKVKGKGQFLQPPIEGIPFQISGDAEMSYDASENWLYMGFRGACGTIDEKNWLIDGAGNLNLHLYEEKPPTFSGNFDGLLKLPKLSNQIPFSWLNSLANFPIEMKTENKFSDNNPNFIYGIALLKTTTFGPCSLKYVIDASKTWYQSGYFKLVGYGENVKSAIIKNKSAILEGIVTETFIVPENNEFGFIEISSPAEAPVSSLTSPSGKKYSVSSFVDNIVFSESEDKKQAFWSFLSAEAGEWEINLENPGSSDSIITFFQLKDKNFDFSMNQAEETITITWDVSQVESGQKVNIMLDSDNANFDGFKIEEVDATAGSLSFSLFDKFPGCHYYLYAQLVDEYKIIEAYAEDVIENPSSTLAPPENFGFEYNSQSGIFDFSWNKSPSSDIAGYILSIADVSGEDSVYAVLESEVENISLFIENFESKYAKIESYNQNWKIGCPAILPSLVTAVNEINSLEEPAKKLQVYPNPTNGNCIIRYYVSEPSKCEIMVYHISGRRIAHPFAGFQSAGFHQVDFEYDNIPNGIYIIQFVNNRESYTVKSILNK